MVGCHRHPPRGDPDLRGAQTDPRHARRPDGGQLRHPRPAVRRLDDDAAADGQLADPQHGRLRRVRRHRAVPVGHPARDGALRPGAVLPRADPPRNRQRDDRGSRGRRQHAGRAAAGRDHRHRARDRPPQLHRERHPARRPGHLRPAGEHLPADRAAARRRRDHPGGPHRRGLLLPPAHRAAGPQPRARHAPSRRHRPHRGERRGGGDRVGGERADFDRPRRHHRARPGTGRPAGPAQGPRRAAAHHGGARRGRGPDESDGLPSVPPPRAQDPLHRAGRRDLADRRRSARRRADDARAARVPQPARQPRADGQPAGHRRGPAARPVRHHRPAAARRGGGGARPHRGAAGDTALPHAVGRSARAVRRRCLPGEPGGAAADVRAGLEARRAGRARRRRRAGAGLSHRTHPVVAGAGDGGRAYQPRRRRRQRDDRAGVGGQRHRQRGRSRRRRRRQRTGAARPAAERHGLGGDRPGRGGQAARSACPWRPAGSATGRSATIEPASVVVVLRGPARRAGADHDGDGLRRRHRHGAGPPLQPAGQGRSDCRRAGGGDRARRRSPCA